MNQKQILPLAIRITLGSSLDVIYGVVFENIAISMSIGAGVGTSIGVALALINFWK
jgi:hypothetical protein